MRFQQWSVTNSKARKEDRVRTVDVVVVVVVFEAGA